MKIKVSEATNIQIDWLVAKCEGHVPLYKNAPTANLKNTLGNIVHLDDLCYSTNWAQGGPILERELLAPEPMLDSDCNLIKWRCRNWKGDGEDFYGTTLLIPALRCFCVSRLGEYAEVPDEFL